MHPWKIGDVANNRFELLSLLGEGSMSAVWRVRDRQTGRICALKLYRTDSLQALVPEYTEHLKAVQRELTCLNIPTVSVPLEFGEFDGWEYQLSAYQEDLQSLDGIIRRSGPLHPNSALNIISNIADAVSALHERNLIHADLKPANVLISERPDWTVRVIDFGMVQRTDVEEPFW